MKLEQSFEVDAPLERVWQTLVDVEHVAPCLPGAAVTGRNEDGSYNGTFTVKIGPTTASYTGKLEMESIDETSHTATKQAQGTDKRGQGGAKATIFSRLAPAVPGAPERLAKPAPDGPACPAARRASSAAAWRTRAAGARRCPRSSRPARTGPAGR